VENQKLAAGKLVGPPEAGREVLLGEEIGSGDGEISTSVWTF
jgi:hypothetical protein